MPRMSLSFMMSRSSPSILTSVPDHLPNSTRSPAFTSSGIELAAFVAGAGADRDDLAFLRLFLGGVGNDDAAFGLFLAFEALDHDAVVQGTERHVGFFLILEPADVVKIIRRQRDKKKLIGTRLNRVPITYWDL